MACLTLLTDCVVKKKRINMKYLTSLAFLACILFFLITASASLPTDSESLLHIFGKRNPKCQPCDSLIANANFVDDPFRGLAIFYQDEQGYTTVTGYFSKGFQNQNTNSIKFEIVNDCDEVIYDLTSGGLDVKFTEDGGTKTFSHKFKDLNLKCDENGILFAKCKNHGPGRKHSRRQEPSDGGGVYMQISGDPSASAPLYV